MGGKVRKKYESITNEMSRHVWLSLAFMALLMTGVESLRNVRLEMIPEVVHYGEEVTLQCHYDLEDAMLYSLKWYRGTYEFYRYSPGEKPAIKMFHFNWIEVDQKHSNEHQVTIRKVGFQLTGNFSCEVTTDAPTFSTASSSKTLTVISVPEGKPVIVSESSRYQPGDTLRARCSTPTSKPPARLFFTLNNLTLEENMTTSKGHDSNAVPQNIKNLSYKTRKDHHHDPNSLQRTDINLILKPHHYVNGQLKLRCTIKISDIFENYSEVHLGSNLKEPVPERVTSNNTSINCHRIADITIFGIIILHLPWR